MHEKPDKLRVAIISGAAIGAVWAIPGLNLLNCCCCAGVILGGVLAVYLYKHEFGPETPPMESSDAAILGIMAGVVAAFVATTFSLIVTAIFGDVTVQFALSFLEEFIGQMEEEGSVPPGTLDELREAIEQSAAQSKTVSGVLMDLVVNLIINPLFAMLGALIGYGLLRKKQMPGNLPQAQQ